LLCLCLATKGTRQSKENEVRAQTTTTVMPRAAESCPGELDSLSASVPNAKEVTKAKLCAGSH